ncbi:MAG: hypothetical protein ACPGLV_08220 [Bacteroidia bacterium]
MSKIEFWILGILTATGCYSALGFAGAGYGLIIYLSVLAILLLYKSIDSKKWPEILIGPGLAGSWIGNIFKMMHWAGAGALMLLGVVSIVGFIAIGIRFLNQSIYGSQKFSLIMIFLGLFISLIHSILRLYHVIPSAELGNLSISYHILIILPTLLLLFTRAELFKQKEFYPVMLIITSYHFVTLTIYALKILDIV